MQKVILQLHPVIIHMLKAFKRSNNFRGNHILHVQVMGTVAHTEGIRVVGRYNIPDAALAASTIGYNKSSIGYDTSAVFIVGCGQTSGSTHDAFTGTSLIVVLGLAEM